MHDPESDFESIRCTMKQMHLHPGPTTVSGHRFTGAFLFLVATSIISPALAMHIPGPSAPPPFDEAMRIGGAVAASAWRDCQDGEAMIEFMAFWITNADQPFRRKITLMCCECARLALPCIPEGERRPRRAIELTEAWARGDPNVTSATVSEAVEAANQAAAGAQAQRRALMALTRADTIRTVSASRSHTGSTPFDYDATYYSRSGAGEARATFWRNEAILGAVGAAGSAARTAEAPVDLLENLAARCVNQAAHASQALYRSTQERHRASPEGLAESTARLNRAAQASLTHDPPPFEDRRNDQASVRADEEAASTIRAKCAQIVRKYFPTSPMALPSTQ